MKNSYFILIVILQSLFLILYFALYITEFGFKEFIDTLKSKSFGPDKEYIIRPFTNVFNDYWDNAGLGFALKEIFSFFVMFFTLIELIILTVLFFKKGGKCQKIMKYVLIILSFINMIIYLVIAFISKYKVDLEDEKIYIFDDDFNNEIKANLNYMFIRKIFLIICPFAVIIGMVFQFIRIVKTNDINIGEFGQELSSDEKDKD